MPPTVLFGLRIGHRIRYCLIPSHTPLRSEEESEEKSALFRRASQALNPRICHAAITEILLAGRESHDSYSMGTSFHCQCPKSGYSQINDVAIRARPLPP
ncbi:hypothetical protein TNIN_4441 [Trichonephila inaurata madagascariensis]|uniref:Uncharacterized protein n=1 Tax=Trichonephila inaurata madagascariensis TaxID=2747483 RepID=A0A8X6X1T8_9ARAC|nr:hypothetical protein TNIN_4441 [Trichonephila inaurata madagascariensis]